VFSIELIKFYWIDDNTDNPDDLCLHGDVFVNIGNERIETSCTVSATALYLLKTLTEDHAIHKGNQMLPCCGHFYIPNSTNDTVDIRGCPNGMDWAVFHIGDNVRIINEQGEVRLVQMSVYKKAVYDFADTIQHIYEKCSPKNVPKDDFEKKGYTAFWNEWERRRNDLGDAFFCPAISHKIDAGLCWECCFSNNGGPKDVAERLENWIADTHIYKDVKEFHSVCELCSHCQRAK
jgi:hypothetical protein